MHITFKSVILGIVLFMLVAIDVKSCDVKTYIPNNAKIYLPTLYKTIDTTLESKNPFYFGSLIEQESCVRICGNNYWTRRCWSPISELKTKREYGVGFGQITKAYRRDGRLRFDTLYNLKQRYPKELKDLTWDNIKEKPDLQMKAILLLWRDIFITFPKTIPYKDRVAFTDSIYNGGYKYFNYERKLCKLTKDCNQSLWFKNVENMKSKRANKKLYGNKSAWDINREHVHNVLKIRYDKYRMDYIDRIDICIINLDTNKVYFKLKD